VNVSIRGEENQDLLCLRGVGRGKPKEKLGPHPGYTVKKARVEAKKKLGMSADGHDFQIERRHKKVLKAASLGSYAHLSPDHKAAALEKAFGDGNA
jgi:hypothetical protein